MNDFLASVLAAYRRGQTADILRGKVRGAWGAAWTIPPCSPEAAARAGRQFSHMRAERLSHIRRAVLTSENIGDTEVVVLTDLPSRRQVVLGLSAGARLRIARYLSDEALSALDAAFTPTRTQRGAVLPVRNSG